jgi:hypothetical protein
MQINNFNLCLLLDAVNMAHITKSAFCFNAEHQRN